MELKNLNIRRYAFIFLQLLLIVSHTVRSITTISLPDSFFKLLFWAIFSLSVFLLLASFKDLRLNAYLLFVLIFIVICAIQTHSYDAGIFKDHLKNFVEITCMVISLIAMRKNSFESKKKQLNVAELVLLVILLVINIFSTKRLFIDGNLDGITGSQNVLGLFAAFICMISTKRSILSNQKYKKILYFGFAIYGSIMLYKTTCRSGMLGLIGFFGILILFFLYKKDEKLFKTVLNIIIVGIVVFVGILSLLLLVKPEETMAVIISVLTGRYELWFIGFPDVMENNWLFGVGPFTLENYARAMTYYHDYSIIYYFFHNWLLDLLYYCGVLGSIIYFNFYLDISRVIKKKRILNNIEMILSLGVVVGILLATCFDILFFFDGNCIYYLMFLELGILLNQRSEAY